MMDVAVDEAPRRFWGRSIIWLIPCLGLVTATSAQQPPPDGTWIADSAVEVERSKLDGKRGAILKGDRERNLVAQETIEGEAKVPAIVQAADKLDRVVAKAHLAPWQARSGHSQTGQSGAHGFYRNGGLTLRGLARCRTPQQEKPGKSAA